MIRQTTSILAIAAAVCLAGCATTAEPGLRGRYVSESKVAIQVNCEGAEPKTLAVVVGVNQYQDERISDLQGAASDAWAFYHYLASPAGGGLPEPRLRLRKSPVN